jgi:putative addiction module component (TIGR02574 family)
LKEAAAKLTTAERADLAYILLQSLDTDPEGEEAFELERAWLFEVERRAGEVDHGDVTRISGDEVLADVRQKLAALRGHG